MEWNVQGTHVQEGDLAQLIGLTHKNHLVRIKAGGELHTHRGLVRHDDLIGKPWGSRISSHQGNPFFVLQPTIGDIIRDLPRATQILYAKDIGYIIMMLGIGPGVRVIEAGTGSCALTSVLAYLVGDSGRVYTYEAREDMYNLAQNNLGRIGLTDRVEFKLRNIEQGFDERDVDALFLDLPNPNDYMAQAREALKPGGCFGCILPTTNQVRKLLYALHEQQFAFVDVCEISLRYYKTDPERLRPVDRMVAHTGYLIFGRKVMDLGDQEAPRGGLEDEEAAEPENWLDGSLE